MEPGEMETAIDQLVGASELVAAGESGDARLGALQTLAFFRLRRTRLSDPALRATSDDALFKDTAIAALTMAGRKEYLASAALLEQARSLLSY
ncbi:hypothetical protein BVER_05025 [Candidatus Burkholderia verschuerenii]|uniref:Uncharacterized protein n=1 Tax=Candidatus Burkholderia verschuerenii TaxID=242163 RepID=A0A0L0M8W8_9BURK|nr:hypothetical protein [Candidatus Burkholderia verschuerenii]KND59092.1 hypothetical protein BVER_05025 [Candidatus Burkholderia verschuerenii]